MVTAFALLAGTVGTPVGVAILGIVSVVLGSLITQIFGRKKNAAETADLISQAAGRLIGDLTRRIDVLVYEVHLLRAEVTRLGGDPNIASHSNTGATVITTVATAPISPPVLLVPHERSH